MKVNDDREMDSMTITLRDSPIDESDDVRPGVIADFGPDGRVVRFEILGASDAVEDTRHVEMSVSSGGGTLSED